MSFLFLVVTVEQNASTLWIKTLEGSILGLKDKYQPSFYILPKNGAELFHTLSQITRGGNMDYIRQR
jgi:hypothetical protein